MLTSDLLSKKTIFLDFDGVIKESVEVKSKAFEQLFITFDEGVARRVKEHHEENGGMSRFDKLPIYLEWAKLKPTDELVNNYSDKFSALVKQKVIDSDWVPYVYQFIRDNIYKQSFFIITATPQSEIEEIVQAIGLLDYFKKIVGAPVMKSDALRKVIEEFCVDRSLAVMIGDSISDYEAAMDNQISFILRRTALNKSLQMELGCAMINDFNSYNRI